MRALLYLALVACGAPTCPTHGEGQACVTWAWTFRDPVTKKDVGCPSEVTGFVFTAWRHAPAEDAGIEYSQQGSGTADCDGGEGAYLVNTRANHIRMSAMSAQGVYGFVETATSVTDGNVFSGVIETDRGYARFDVTLFSTTKNAPRGCGTSSDLGPMYIALTSTRVDDPADTVTDIIPCGDPVVTTSGRHPGTYDITLGTRNVMLMGSQSVDTGQHVVMHDKVTDGGPITINTN